jgi:hypothetical protein
VTVSLMSIFSFIGVLATLVMEGNARP